MSQLVFVKQTPLNSFARKVDSRGSHLVFCPKANRLIGFGGNAGWNGVLRSVVSVELAHEKGRSKSFLIEHNVRGWGVFGRAVEKRRGDWVEKMTDRTLMVESGRICCGIGCGDDDLMIIFGGKDEQREASDRLFVVKVELNQETGYPDFVNHGDEVIVEGGDGDGPSPRWGHSMINIGENEWLVFGGKDEEDEFGDLWRMKLKEGRIGWEEMEMDGEDGPSGRNEGVWWRDRLVVVETDGGGVWGMEVEGEERGWIKMMDGVGAGCEAVELLGDLLVLIGMDDAFVQVMDLEGGRMVDVECDDSVVRRNGMAVGRAGDNEIVLFGGMDQNGVVYRQAKLRLTMFPWSVETHWMFPKGFRRRVMQVMLMWNHDQYEEGECEGIRWNELPWEVVLNIIRWLGLYER